MLAFLGLLACSLSQTHTAIIDINKKQPVINEILYQQGILCSSFIIIIIGTSTKEKLNYERISYNSNVIAFNHIICMHKTCT